MGAAGVGLGATAAHLPGAASLAVASTFLLLHAVAVLALDPTPAPSRLTTAAKLLLIVGAVLFSGTLVLDNLAGLKIRPSPAPIGGSLLIFGWLVAALALLLQGAEDRR